MQYPHDDGGQFGWILPWFGRYEGHVGSNIQLYRWLDIFIYCRLLSIHCSTSDV